MPWCPGQAGASTTTAGTPARRMALISGCRFVEPQATMPSTVARSSARDREPCSGEMNSSAEAVLLGHGRDTLREQGEERVGEDLAKRLG